MSAAEWAEMPSRIREEAFFSAKLEHARHVEELKKGVLDALRGTWKRVGDLRGYVGKDPDAKVLWTRGQFIREMRKAARERGILPTGPRAIEDQTSYARLKLIFDMNEQMARNKSYWLERNKPHSLEMYPAHELVRVERRIEPRNWPERWSERGEGIGWEGALPLEKAGGRMIALVGSPIWKEISEFGLPYPPFDYNSGMGFAAVGYLETRALGLLAPGEKPPDPAAPPREIRRSVKSMDAATRQWLLDGLRKRNGEENVWIEGDELVYLARG